MQIINQRTPRRILSTITGLTLISLFVACGGGSSGTGTGTNSDLFEGTVFNAAGDPLSGVTVTTSGSDQSVMTDEQGQFQIATDAPDGSVEFVFSAPGLETSVPLENVTDSDTSVSFVIDGETGTVVVSEDGSTSDGGSGSGGSSGSAGGGTSDDPIDPICVNTCGNGSCEEIVCLAIGCPCGESQEICPEDCPIDGRGGDPIPVPAPGPAPCVTSCGDHVCDQPVCEGDKCECSEDGGSCPEDCSGTGTDPGSGGGSKPGWDPDQPVEPPTVPETCLDVCDDTVCSMICEVVNPDGRFLPLVLRGPEQDERYFLLTDSVTGI